MGLKNCTNNFEMCFIVVNGEFVIVEYFEDAQEHQVVDGFGFVVFAGQGELDQLHFVV